MTIDRSGPLPLHVQLQDELRGLIADGEFPPGSRLPTELALAERFGVNRLTVRQALAELRIAGLVIPRQGVGTFVAAPPEPFEVDLNPTDWRASHERGAAAAAALGRVLTEELIDVETVDVPACIAEHLGRGRMLWLEGLTRVDAVPSIRSQYWARSALTPDEVRRLATGGLNAPVLTEIVGHDMYYAWRSFDAVAAGRRDAQLLQVPTGAPLLQRCGLNTDAVGRPLLYLQRDAPSRRMRIVLRSQPGT